MEAAFWLLLARLVLMLLPFRRVASRLGILVSPTDERARPHEVGVPCTQAHIAAQIGWAVQCSARHVPFKAVCLPQAIAGRIMLKRRSVKSILRLGTILPDQTNPGLRAHAWLDAAGVKVTGYPAANDFTEIASFI